MSSKLGLRVSKDVEFCADFKNLLRQEVPKDFFSEKRFFAQFSKSLKNQFFCKIVSPFAKLETLESAQIPLLFIPCTANFEEFFFNSHKLLFSKDKRSNKKPLNISKNAF